MLIIASKAGAPTNPDWYHNLKAHPRIDVEVGTEIFPVTAEELSRVERDEKWPMITAMAPGYADYQRKTSRVIPVFALRRA
jgi:deazaflavin-dependent oxidoreductase (nitroreductase family)